MGVRADRLSEAVRDERLFNRAGPRCAAARMDHCSWPSRHGIAAALPRVPSEKSDSRISMV